MSVHSGLDQEDLKCGDPAQASQKALAGSHDHPESFPAAVPNIVYLFKLLGSTRLIRITQRHS